MTPEQAAAAPAAVSVAAHHPRSDLGNARRCVAAHGRNLRYVHGHGWFHWTGIVCQSDTDGVVTRLIADVTDQILAEAVVAPEDQRKAAVAFALSSQSARPIAAALELAAADSRSRPSPISSTPIPCLLAVANGTDALRTGHCRPVKACRPPDPREHRAV
jgi:putative DNA primase/helicase